MIRYKHQTHKSNSIKVEVEAGFRYQSVDGAVTLDSGVCALRLALTPGEHVVSGRYLAGAVDGEPVMGETVLHYCMDAGRFIVCDYDFQQKLAYEAPEHYKCPEFRLVKTRKETDGAGGQEEEVLLQVSARHTEKDIRPLGKRMALPVGGCRKRLRKVHETIEKALAEAGIPVYKRLDEIPQYDESGRIVGGVAIGTRNMRWGTVFFNMIWTTFDRPFGGVNWLQYYWANTRQNMQKCCAMNIGVNCSPATVSLRWRYKGAHIGGAANMTVPFNPWLRGTHMYQQAVWYEMVPLCARHNRQGGMLPMSCNPSDGVLPVAVLVLNSFKHTIFW